MFDLLSYYIKPVEYIYPGHIYKYIITDFLDFIHLVY